MWRVVCWVCRSPSNVSKPIPGVCLIMSVFFFVLLLLPDAISAMIADDNP